jgi:hypothetical protein
MKLFAIIPAVILAQEDYDYEERKKNNAYSGGNNNNYNGGNNNNYNGGNNYNAYGDPHFMVHTEGQESVCFDYTPSPDTEMNLLIDPSSSLSVTAHATKNEEDNKTRMTTINLSSPEGAHLAFNLDGVHHSGIGTESPSEPDALTGVQTYGDVNFIVHQHNDMGHQSVKIYIQNGPTFTVKISNHHGGLNFAVDDPTTISDSARGLLGGFIRPDAYHVMPLNTMTEDDEPMANVVINKFAVSASKGSFHKTENCWIVEDEEVAHMLANL